MVQDYDFVSEVGWMGHGLQMWLQIMWFLARVSESETIILDEPDVYMHPDLQRKLIRFLIGRYKQVIIATHSVEIIAEVEPENILIIDKQKRRSNYANKLPSVQKIQLEAFTICNWLNCQRQENYL
jgi:predicted ATPase